MKARGQTRETGVIYNYVSDCLEHFVLPHLSIFVQNDYRNRQKRFTCIVMYKAGLALVIMHFCGCSHHRHWRCSRDNCDSSVHPSHAGAPRAKRCVFRHVVKH